MVVWWDERRRAFSPPSSSAAQRKWGEEGGEKRGKHFLCALLLSKRKGKKTEGEKPKEKRGDALSLPSYSSPLSF